MVHLAHTTLKYLILCKMLKLAATGSERFSVQSENVSLNCSLLFLVLDVTKTLYKHEST